MLKTILVALLTFNMFYGNGTANLFPVFKAKAKNANSGTMEKLIVANGTVTMDLDLGVISDRRKSVGSSSIRFDAEAESMFTSVVYNDELRGILPGTMKIFPQSFAQVPTKLGESFQRLVLEKTEPGEHFDFVIRDIQTGFTFFGIEGAEVAFDGVANSLNLIGGRIIVTDTFAAALGNKGATGRVAGTINLSANLRVSEVTEIENGEVVSSKMASRDSDFAGTVPGPDVVVGDVTGLAQFGSSSGTQVGLAVGTDSCNFGTVDLNWFQNPSNDHPVIPQNLYRMSGGSDNTGTFEQVGQGQVKHAFTALTQNLCGLGCNGVGGSRLGSGCSDPYTASLNAGPNLGSRAWINPFTGFYPRGDSATPNNNHSGHVHNGTSHRILTEISDLSTTSNSGASYFAEAQYVTPHEYAWCQTNPAQCNMNNNVSYRRYTVSGTTSPFSFSPVGSTVRAKPAVMAWTGSTTVEFRPDSANDGIGFVGYKVTNPSPGVWHYEYAVYNQNLDRAIQQFSVPTGNGATISNVGFHAPPQHPGSSGDGTGSVGFSSTPWATSTAGNAMSWSTETLAQNANANAIRWGTMYNFRFDSNQPPVTTNATLGFFKTGAPITVQVQGPGAGAVEMASVSGRVMSSAGRGVRNAKVTITNTNGQSAQTFYTGTFGYYSFGNITPGSSYTISVSGTKFSFAPQTMQINSSLTDVNFLPQ